VAFWLRHTERTYHIVGRSLGFSYEDGALVSDGTAPIPFDTQIYRPTDRPGARFPHLWLDLSRRRSTLDWFDTELALVTGPRGSEWLDAGMRVARDLNIPLRLESLPVDGASRGIEIGLRGAVLVRPDGHVAWRRPWLSPDPALDIKDALAAVLGRSWGCCGRLPIPG
jgi:hypothetical protein